MLYDAYEKKIRKRYKYFKLIHKFRILIMAIILMVVSLTTTFMITKGMVYGVEYDESINYGDEIKISSSSFMSEHSYSYSKVGSNNFTKQVPKVPGDYQIKVTTKGVFNSNREKILPFTIKERDVKVEINLDEVEFGMNPFDFNIDLPYEDYIADIEFDYTSPGEKISEIKLRSIKINNKYDEDVTSFYNINHTAKVVEFVERKITVELLSYQSTYDALVHTSNKFEIKKGSLVDGHYLVMETTGEIQTVGEVNNKIKSITIYDEEDIDVTKNYEITQVDSNSKLKLNKRDLTLSLTDKEQVYNTKTLTNNEFNYSVDELLSGHEVSITTTGSITDYIKGGITNNIDKVTILDYEGTDVTNNYNIIKKSGKLTINKYLIEVTTGSAEFIYNGLEHFVDEYTYEGELFGDDKLDIVYLMTEINAGSHINATQFKVVNDKGEESHNYAINHTNGVIEIKKREITIQHENDEKIYDSKYFYNTNYSILNSSNDEGFASGHTLSIQNNSHETKYINVGTYENTFDFIIVDDNNMNVSGNYDITIVKGELIITERIITIETDSANKIYDGIELSAPFINELDIALNDKFEVTFKSLKNVGSIKNDVELIIYRKGTNEDVLSNYEIEYIFGDLTVNERPIQIKLKDDSKIYDGTKLENKEFEYINSEYDILPDEDISYQVESSITDVGEEVNVIVEGSIKITKKSGEDSTHNYDINVLEGLLTITKRPIIIKPEFDTRVYDGTVFTSNKAIVSESSEFGLVLDHYINITTDGEILNVGLKGNSILSHDILDLDNYNHNDNYEVIRYESDFLEVTPRLITIKSNSESKVYDGLILSNQGYKILEGSIVDGETLVVSAFKEITNVNNIDNVLEYEIYNKDNELFKENYNITRVHGELEITPRTIIVKPVDKQNVYDGLWLYNDLDEYEYLEKSPYKLVLDHILEITTDGKIKNVDNIVNNIIGYTIKTELGIDETSNYNVEVIPGKLVITPRVITVTTGSDDKTYDGKYLFNENIDITGTLADNQNIVITSLDYLTKYINVGIYDNILEYMIIDEDGIDVTFNYDITNVHGKLEIVIRKLHIKTNSYEKVYDDISLFDYTLTFLDDTSVPKENDNLEIVEYTSIINVGKVENIVTILITGDNGRGNTIKNYDIKFENGFLEITPRNIKIKGLDKEKVYDGLALFNEKNEYEYVNSENEIVDGHTLEIETSESIIDAVSIDNNKITDVKIFKDSLEVTDNYDVKTEKSNLEIHKRTLTVQPRNKEKVYDGLPLSNSKDEYAYINSEYELVVGETLEIETNGEIIDVGENISSIKSFKVFNNERDVTHNYDLVREEGTLKVVPREIRIKPQDKEKVYDGLPLFNEAHEYMYINSLYELVLDHILKITTDGNITNVEKIDNNIKSLEIIDSNGIDKAHNYKVLVEKGTLEIIPKEVIIETGSEDKTYDAEYFNNEQIIVVPGTSMLEKHKIKIINEKHLNKYIDHGKHKNIIEYMIVDESGEDVTSNYDIITIYGTLIINKRTLDIKTNNLKEIYDGTIYTDDTINFLNGTRIPENDRLDKYFIEEIINVGRRENIIKINIYGNNDRGLTNDNYIINYNYGTLEITPREITITTFGYKTVYNADYHYYEKFEVTDNIADGQFLNIFGEKHLTSYINVGLYDNEMEFKITDSLDNDVTSNYEITFVYGKIEITLRKLDIATNSHKKTYDGKKLFDYTIKFDNETSIPENDSYSIDSYTSIINIGKKENVVLFTIIGNNRGNTMSNYDITYKYGELEITPLEISIKPSDKFKEYDDTWLYNEYFEIDYLSNSKTIAEGHEIRVTTSERIKDFGRKTNHITNCFIYDVDGNDVTGNYKVLISSGELRIDQREIILGPKPEIIEYDGMEHKPKEVENDGLVFGHKVVNVEFEGSIKDVGTVTTHIISYDIVDENGISVKNNYHVTLKTSYIKIIYPDSGGSNYIIIKPKDVTFEYDGTEKTSNEVAAVAGLIAGHYVEIVTSGKITEPGKVSNPIQSYTIYDETGNVVTSNYDENKIILQAGEIIVTSSVITIRTSSDRKVYGDTSLNTTGHEVIEGTLGEEHKLVVYERFNKINVGIYDNDTTFIIVDDNGQGKDVTRNYVIKYDYGTLEIIKRDLSLRGKYHEKVFDGKYFNEPEYEIVGGTTLAYKDQLKVFTQENIMRVGEHELKLNYSIHSNEIVDVTGNYNIVSESGILVITKITIELEQVTGQAVYNGTNRVDVLISHLLEDVNLDINLTFILPNNIVGNYTSDEIVGYEIFHENGVDITDSIDILISKDNQIKVYEREIIIKPEDVRREYNGTPLISDKISYKTGSGYKLVWGHTIIITTTKELINVGKVEDNEISSYIILDGSGKDVTKYYEVITDFGTLEVFEQIIKIETLSSKKIYDDEYFYYDKMIVSSEKQIEDIHELYVLNEDHHELYKDAGKYTNKFDIGIRDKVTHEDVTDNYDITEYVYGTLTINKRDITIKPTYKEKQYDGTELVSKNYEYDDLGKNHEILPNHRVEIETDGRITNVGFVVNKITGYTIFNNENNNVTNNYEVNLKDSELVILERKLTIKTGNINEIYSATYFYNINYEILDDGRLAQGEEIKILDSNYFKYFNAVKTINELDLIIVGIDNNDITDQYDITYVYGKVNIEKRDISLKAEGLKVVYDGNDHHNESIIITGGSLADGDILNIIKYPTITNAGKLKNKLEYTMTNESENIGDVKDNYNIHITYDDLVVEKREITIKPLNVDEVYNGLKQTTDIIEVTIGSLAEQETISANINGFGINVGMTYTNVIDSTIKILKSDGKTNSLNNYNIELDVGEVLIRKREITISPVYEYKYYDGLPLFGKIISTTETSENSLVERQEITGVISGSQTEVGIGNDSIISFVIRDELGRDVTINYSVSKEDGELEVLPELIKIKAKEATKQYDGMPLTSNIAVTTKELPEGFRIVITTRGSIIEPGRIDNEIDEYFIYNQFGEDVTDNYSVKVNEPDYIGTLTVKMTVVIQVYKKVLSYDGTAKFFKNDEFYYPIREQRLPEDYILLLDINGSITEVGEITSDVKVHSIYKKNDIGGKDYIDVLFKVEVINSTIIVNPRKITLTAESASRAYDGEVLQSNDFNVTHGSLVANQFLVVNFTEDSKITDIGKTENVIDRINTFVLDKDSNVITSNYEITFINGILEVRDNNQILYIEEQLDLKFRKGFYLRENNSLK